MKTLLLSGSTGSIGRQTLDVLRAFPGQFRVIGLTAHTNEALLKEQAEEFLGQDGLYKPKFEAESVPGHGFSEGALLSPTPEQIAKLVAQADFIINALPGFAGLEVSLAAVRAGKILLSANKESLAIAGRWLRELAAQTGAQIRPLDSEASAIWQLLHSAKQSSKKTSTESDTISKKNQLSSVTLTCSGGPFYGKTREQLEHVTVEEALAHPTWKMGPKVSIDSATLVNKVLEVYEVHNLFDVPLKDIHIVIHRQSLVHSMVHLKSGATRMHITQNDMRLFISYALHYPNQPVCPWPILRARKSELDFDAPDAETFRPLKWLELHAGNPNFPIVLNALNDCATAAFLAGQLSFLEIYDFIEAGLDQWLWRKPPASLEEALALHEEVTESVQSKPMLLTNLKNNA